VLEYDLNLGTFFWSRTRFVVLGNVRESSCLFLSIIAEQRWRIPATTQEHMQAAGSQYCTFGWDRGGEVFAPRQRAAGNVADPYCLKINGGPLTRFPLRSTVTSTRSAIVTKGIPLFIP
jgi:hypothetical protein